MSLSPRCATTLFAALTVALPAQNLLVDGDLEGHTAIGCTYNQSIAQFNAAYANVHSFGISSGIDIMVGNCYGSLPHSGATKLALAWNNAANGDKDAMALDFTAPLTQGASYALSLWAEHLPFGTPQPFEIGVSGAANAFGTLVFFATPTSSWGNFTATFTAPFAATHLTVQCPSGPDTWIAFDHFDLRPATTPATNTVFGTACGGLALAGATRPVIGTTWNLQLTAVPGNATLALMLIDFVNPNLALGAQAPGCTQYSGGLLLVLLPLPVGNPAVMLALPASSGLVGLQLYAQGGALVPGANPLGIAASNGLLGTVGNV